MLSPPPRHGHDRVVKSGSIEIELVDTMILVGEVHDIKYGNTDI